MRNQLLLITLLLAACGEPHSTDEQRSSASRGPVAASTLTHPSVAAAHADENAASNAMTAGLAQRRGETTNPDGSTIVFLYFDLAGIPAPIDQWVEEDSRVAFAPGPEKAARRSAVKAELAAGAAAVRSIGYVRLTMGANLSEYDPTYGEFTVRALAPSSLVSFGAFRQKVNIRFGNAKAAQIWRVPPAEAQAIRDKLGYSSALLDVLVRITGVLPAPQGGAITANVVEYELRDASKGFVLGRVQVGE